MRLRIVPATDLGPDAVALADLARDEGFAFAERLVGEWRSGANRFDRPGEMFAEARDGQVLVGFGGLNRCPYAGDPGVGRLRHVYVRADRRAQGVGRALVSALLRRAGTFHRVRLRAADGAAAFYERLGFSVTDEVDATHAILTAGGGRLRAPRASAQRLLPARPAMDGS